MIPNDRIFFYESLEDAPNGRTHQGVACPEAASASLI